jgi:hypothetical protein
MVCLHCGYCCITYDVVIVLKNLGPRKSVEREENIEYKPTNQRCRHITGNVPGEFLCGIHKFPWYKKTPCFNYVQIERKNTNCRMGEFVLKNEKMIKLIKSKYKIKKKEG